MFRSVLSTAVCAEVAVAVAAVALAQDKQASLTFGDPTKEGTVSITLYDAAANPVGGPYEIKIGPGDVTAAQKAKLIHEKMSLQAVGSSYSGGATVKFEKLPNNVKAIGFKSGDTGELPDIIVVEAVKKGAAAFEGFFAPMDVNKQPALFVAGIVTDVGELSATISAQELNFQTEGPIICQALFQKLAPKAPQFGAQINYAGDRLEIYFDPAYTATQGGIVFGTTSPSPGASGVVEFKEPIQPVCPGDVNGDGMVCQDDLGLLLSSYGACVGSPLYNPDADFDKSGCVDQSDIGVLLGNYGCGGC